MFRFTAGPVSFLAVVAASFLHVCVAADGTPFNSEVFDRMVKEDRLAVVLAGLRDHDGALNNSEFNVSLTATTTIETGTSATRTRFRLKSIGRKYFCEVEDTIAGINGGKGDYLRTSKTAWDGSVSQTWSFIQGNPHASGMISQTEPDSSGDAVVWLFTDQLGMRRKDHSMSVADWIEDLIKQRKLEWDVQSFSDNQKPMVRITVGRPSRSRYEYVVDPAHQFVIKRNSIFEGVPGEDLRKIDDIMTDEIHDVNDTWIPWRITRNTSLKGLSGKMVFGVTECKLGKLTDADLSFSFTPGTMVIDQTKGVAFDIQKDGSQRPLPLLNPKTGTVSGGATSKPTTRFGPKD